MLSMEIGKLLCRISKRCLYVFFRLKERLSSCRNLRRASNLSSLRVAVSVNAGQMKFYKFTVLPFGLCTAPYIFTKLLKPLEKRWRYLGIRIAIFLDDGWGIEKDKPQCEHTSNLVKSDLASTGFLSKNEKSVWAPTQSLIWIGILWNTLEGTIALTPKRLEKICDTIQAIADAKFVISARQLASFTGQIISTGPIVGSVTRIMTRHCVLSTVAAEHWDKLIYLDEYTKNELFFWKNNLSYLKTRHCFLHSTPHKFVYSDASDTGCGSLLTLDTKQICHKLWDEHERSKSSTWCFGRSS